MCRAPRPSCKLFHEAIVAVSTMYCFDITSADYWYAWMELYRWLTQIHIAIAKASRYQALASLIRPARLQSKPRYMLRQASNKVR